MPREALEHVRRGIGSVCSQALEASWDWEWLLAEAGAPGQQALGTSLLRALWRIAVLNNKTLLATLERIGASTAREPGRLPALLL